MKSGKEQHWEAARGLAALELCRLHARRGPCRPDPALDARTAGAVDGSGVAGADPGWMIALFINFCFGRPDRSDEEHP